MPYVQRKKSILSAIKSVLLAPFALLLVGVVTGLPFLILGAVLCLWCMWMAGEPWGNLVPTQELLVDVLGMMTIVIVASIPLAIRDHFSNGGYETVWEHAPELDDFAQKIGDLLMHGEFATVYERFSTDLKAKIPRGEFEQYMQSPCEKLTRRIRVTDARELDSVPLHPKANSVVCIVFQHFARTSSILELHVNHSDDTEVLHFAYYDAEEDDW